MPFTVDFLLLIAAAPFMYAPQRFGAWGIGPALTLLVTGWLWRRQQCGLWYQRTPGDWAIAILILGMLPISIWIAPADLRMVNSWPKALVLVWNFQLFVVIVTHVSRRRQLLVSALFLFIGIGLLLALVAPWGTNWQFKLAGLEAVLSHIPFVLGALSREGESGFHPNIVAGALLYVLPLMISLAITIWRHDHRSVLAWLLAASTLYVLGIFILLQSRSGYIGLITALVAMYALHYKWGRRLLSLGALLLLAMVLYSRGEILATLADNPALDTVGGMASLQNFRTEVWATAIMAITDFPFTGLGLGTFQDMSLLLYMPDISPYYYYGHAHNFWLQSALDFGLPGLIATIALYLTAIAQIQYLWRSSRCPKEKGLVAGLAGCLTAQSIYSLTDAIPMGSTANLLFWILFGLIFALGNLRALSQNTDFFS